MPTTHRSSGGNSVGAGRQSTLSFNNTRVTKNVPKSAKDLAASKAKPSPLSKETKPEDEDIGVEPAPVEEVELKIKKEEEEEKEEEYEDVKPRREATEEQDAAETLLPAPKPETVEKTDAEIKAEKATDAQIARYWRGIQTQRIAPRVHQEGLSVSEKVLRYFDVSSQYGPCIGITRLKRWQRAQRLGLNPPPEVLAVLLREEAKGNKKIERAYMDDIMSMTAVGAV